GVVVLANMFAEGEWTDDLPANEQDHSVVNVRPRIVKHDQMSRQCLKRTLETLESASDWECIKPSVVNDEETDKATAHLFKKKQRCKSQKKTSCKEIGRETDILNKTVKQHVKFKVDTANTEKSSKKLYEAVEDKRFSRQQWKNKMKNKRRCKNKFLVNSTGVASPKLPEKKGKPQKVSVAEKIHNNDSSVERDSNVPLSKDTSEDISAHAVTNQLTQICKELANAHSPCEKQRPVNVDKKSWRQAKKLKSILKTHATESDEKLCDTITEQEKEGTVGECKMDLSTALRSRMEKRLQSSRFRYINELLYTLTSGEAKHMFKQDPLAIRIYHEGYTEQVKHWPENPVDSIISYIQQRSSSLIIADFGCGACKIARNVKNKVHCFDLAPVCDLVTVCDMANVPLDDSTVDIAVFCLSLMGTNLTDFLAEANRVLVMSGVLKIAEVASRFDNIRQFIGALSRLGFKLVSK
ncbi:ribosomal RNA-processing protein 8, partial [Clarias magur]